MVMKMAENFLAGLLLFAVASVSWNIVKATHNSPGLCSYTTRHTEYYTAYVSHRTTVCYACGLFEWGRCTKSRYYLRSRTSSRTVYNRASRCCTGYRIDAEGHCQPICNPSCANGGVCERPNTCRCLAGWEGDTCKRPVCSTYCGFNLRCTAPNTCTCEPEWTGSDCQTRLITAPGFILSNEFYHPFDGNRQRVQTFVLNKIREGENALKCVTTRTDCCGVDANGQPDVANSRGHFYYPDGTQVPIGRSAAGDDGLYTERGYRFITLSRRPDAISIPPLSHTYRYIYFYRCNLDDDYGDNLYHFSHYEHIEEGWYFRLSTCGLCHMNGGECLVTQSGNVLCVCPENNTFCYYPVCEFFGCQNGGNCSFHYGCICPHGWTGSSCEIRIIFSFSLNGERYANGSTILWSSIGEGANALQCTTNNTECCGISADGTIDIANRKGEVYYPNGTRIPTRGRAGSDGLFRGRGYQHISLSRKNSATTVPPAGRYLCNIPDERGITQDLYINIVTELPTTAVVPADSTPPHLKLAQIQIFLPEIQECQELLMVNSTTLVRYMSELLVEKITRELSQIQDFNVNETIGVPLQCKIP